ncbi:hypothetical protein [Novosphingobium sp.]|uniref:hypothetical protein n=1 Tax=Novosphingobium sp. TaxID=1874826 RepID=UPI00333E5E05
MVIVGPWQLVARRGLAAGCAPTGFAKMGTKDRSKPILVAIALENQRKPAP